MDNIIEKRLNDLKISFAEIANAKNEDLKTFEILEIKKVKLPIFDVGHCRLREEMYAASSSFLLSHGIKGSLVDFRSSSFNDQVLLGLWDYEK